MGSTLILLFNHQLTRQQESSARQMLGVSSITELPSELKSIWGNVPAHLSEIVEYIAPVRDWLDDHAKSGDYILIQGDFGATYLMVRFAFHKGLIPIYATTRREAVEEVQSDGSVKRTQRFMHQRFRAYGK
jgi:hypothetical protein